MSILEAIILGIVQGLTEFLPVSSSGHLEIGNALLGVDGESNLLFATAVHAGTVLSTIVVFRKQIWEIIRGVFKFTMNPGMQMFLLILISTIPVLFVGVILKDQVESLFVSNLTLVGAMLLVTATLLTISKFVPNKQRPMTVKSAFIMGIAQAIAVLPGLSRSGSTIATGLIMGIDREKVASFSFLMALIPITGAAMLDLIGGDFASAGAEFSPMVFVAGFLAAFVVGALACTVMIRLIKRDKLHWFAIYCAVIGVASIIYSLC